MKNLRLAAGITVPLALLHAVLFAQAPTIFTQPQSRTVAGTYPTVLSVTPTGSGLSYSWSKDGAALAGATQVRLAIDRVHDGHAGTYLVTVSNASGSVTSAPAVLAVEAPLSVTTLLGQSALGDADGPVANARFYQPSGLAFDQAGNLYVTDRQSHTIRRISSEGVVSTVAGKPGEPGFVDGPGSAARFAEPAGITIDSAGNLLVTELVNHTLRRVTLSGAVTTVAGGGSPGYVNASGTAARFNLPISVTVDSAGNAYVGDNANRAIRRITPGGTVTTFAGRLPTAANTSARVDADGTDARFAAPQGVNFDRQGNLLVADGRNGSNGMLVVRRVTPSGAVTTVEIPNGQRDSEGNPVGSVAAQGVTVDAADRIFVVGDREVLRLTTGGIVEKLAVRRSQLLSLVNSGLVVGAGGDVLFVDGPTVGRIAAGGGDYSVVAGLMDARGQTDGGPGTATFYQPVGIAADPDGTLYVADFGTVRKVAPDGVVTTIAGRFPLAGEDPMPTNLNVTQIRDGTGASVRFGQLGGIARGSDGNLYVTDRATVRRVTPGGEVVTIAGNPNDEPPAYADGAGVVARFQSPRGIAADQAGNLYVSDIWSVRKVTLAGDVTTLAGLARVRSFGEFTAAAVDGPGPDARFIAPGALAVDGSGNVFVQDSSAGMRKISATGEVTTLYRGGGGTGYPTVDAAGSLYVSSVGTISKVGSGGILIPVFGESVERFRRDGTGADGRLIGVTVMTTGHDGVIYFSDDFYGPTIRKGVVTRINGAPLNRNPAIEVTAPPATVSARTNQLFSVAGTDPDGDPLSFRWEFGDGSAPVTTAVATHRWISPGTYTVRVTASDGRGGAASWSMVVNVLPDQALRAWTRRMSGQTIVPLDSVVFGGGQFVAVGGNGALRSVDGAVWSATAAGLFPLNAVEVAYGAGRYVAVGSRGAQFGAPPAVAHSVNGDSWQLVNVSANTASFTSVTFGAGRFVAVGVNGRIAISADGLAWNDVASGVTDSLLRVRFGDGRFVAVGSGGRILVSTDGAVWVSRLVPGASSFSVLRGVARLANQWYVTGPPTALYSSGDTETWIRVRPDVPVITATNSGNLAVVDGALVVANGTNSIVYTENATGWDRVTVGVTANELLKSAAEGGGRVVLVGSVGSEGLIYQTALGPRITLQPVSQNLVAGGVTLRVEVRDAAGVTFQWLKNGSALLGATGSTLSLPDHPSSAGSYAVVARNAAGDSTTSQPAIVTASPQDPGRLVNLAIRTDARQSEPLVMGVVLGGTGTVGIKPVLVRGVGPTMVNFGVTGTNPDPDLAIKQGAVIVASNDNWGGGTALRSVFAQVGAFALDPASRDAALLSSLNPGSYTMEIGGVNGATGTVLAEIYDATAAAALTPTTPRLVNVSTRTRLSSGSPLIAGFAIAGDSRRTILIRAVGPTLGAFGVADVLDDPRLDLYTGTTLNASNDNWGGGAVLRDAFTRVGAFSLDAVSKDAALLTTLERGTYTVHVNTASGRSGVVLIEIYEVP